MVKQGTPSTLETYASAEKLLLLVNAKQDVLWCQLKAWKTAASMYRLSGNVAAQADDQPEYGLASP
jgi:hypothetical protein